MCTSNKLLSIVVPVYNVEATLERCVNSLLVQTYSPVEIILVDDGSTDESGKLCDALAKKHQNIRVIHKENGGLATARNAGIKVARGECVTFVDSDDFISDCRTYEYVMEAFCEHPEIEVIQYPYKTYHQDTSLDYTFSCKDALIKMGGGNCLIINDKVKLAKQLRAANWWKAGLVSTSVCDKVFKLSIFELVQFKQMFLEDVFAMVDILERVSAVAIVPIGEYAYCIREGSMLTSEWTLKKSCDELESIIHVYNFVMKCAPESEQVLTTFFWIVSMLTTIKLRFGINYLVANPDLSIKSPRNKPISAYDKLRMAIINTIGLRCYVDLVTSISKFIAIFNHGKNG